MEQVYVIGVANKFDALLDSEDPFEVLQNVEAEKRKKKALKVASSNENKENKIKEIPDAKNKVSQRKPTAKPNDRVLNVDRIVKPDNAVDRTNRRNRDEKPPGAERNGDFPRTGTFRDGGNKGDAPPRGPRPDFQKGDRRDRDTRNNDGEVRPPRGPRPDGDRDRPFRSDRQTNDGDARPPRRDRREFQDSSDGEGRPDRRPGGPRGRGSRPFGPGRNFDNRGKRVMDRRSGSDRTGVKAVDKRDGAGPYNWDSNKDLEALAGDLNVTNFSDEQADWDEGPKPDGDTSGPETEKKENDAPVEETAPPAEEEPKELTLDEYRAIRGKRELPRYDIRKAGEGEDLTQWKDMIEMKKKDEENQDLDYDMEIQDFPQRVGRQRHVVGIDITFNDTFRGGRGRGRGGPPGGRGRGRGGMAREGGGDRDRERERGDRESTRGRYPREDRRDGRDGNRQAAPKVDDEKDFPSLG